MPDVEVPEELVKDNKLVLNVSEQAVSNYSIGPDCLEFDARFNGISKHIRVPPGSIVGVFQKGGKLNYVLDPEYPSSRAGLAPNEGTKKEKKRVAKLRFVE